MTYTIYALSNDAARICHSKTVTTDMAVRDMVVSNLKERGFAVTIEQNG